MAIQTYCDPESKEEI